MFVFFFTGFKTSTMGREPKENHWNPFTFGRLYGDLAALQKTARPTCTKGGRALLMPPPPPVWNLRAVIWFHLSICCLAILPSPAAHSVFSLPWLTQSPAYFPEMSLNFFFSRDRLFCITLVLVCFFQRLGEHFDIRELHSHAQSPISTTISKSAKVLDFLS